VTNFSRRSFLSGLSTIPFALWFEKYAAAQVTTFVRHNVTTLQGARMLKIYANAVGTMVGTAEPNPVGWLFQWYTHNVRGDRTKAGELSRVYPSPSPQRSLAQEMWNTCQAHHAGDVEDYFLPWHRMYVFFLERIVRKVSGHPEFTLPYWNYSNATVPSGPRMPKAFISPASTATNSLFRTNRNASANGGQPIDQSDPGALSLTALAQCTYSQNGVAPGFNMDLDQGLHGNVHVLVGNSQGMGSVPWAANDPIFWMHHCNIDRLWASWNRAGRQNPTTATWLNKQFIFADENGHRVVATVKDFRAIASLKYTYDRFEPVPACPSPHLLEAVVGVQQTRAVVPTGPVELSAAPVQLSLEPPPGPEAADVTIADRVKRLKAGQRLYLVAKNLHADVQPGVLYHVYLDLPPGATPKPGKSDPHYVGTLNFFDAEHSGEGGGMEAMGVAKFRSFDVTRVAKSLQASGHLNAKPTLTIAPAKQPEAEARPVVGEITLVEQ
jgi:tyrosinase